jgi:hypothetical protein
MEKAAAAASLEIFMEHPHFLSLYLIRFRRAAQGRFPAALDIPHTISVK